MIIDIGKEFTRYPAGRYRSDGDYAGEIFRDDILVKKIKAIGDNERLTIDMSNTMGLGSSFLEEVFGGLVREHGYRASALEKILDFKSDKEPYLIDETWSYIRDADKVRFGGK